MEGLEVTVLLGLTILVGTLLAPRVRLALPLVLVVLGLLLGFKALFLLPVTLIGGGWLGLRMLDALLRR